jgi:hypothetical protein
VKNAAELARSLNLTRARISQILSLLRLAPEILAYIDNLKGDEGQMFLTAKMLLPLAKLARDEQQDKPQRAVNRQPSPSDAQGPGRLAATAANARGLPICTGEPPQR